MTYYIIRHGNAVVDTHLDRVKAVVALYAAIHKQGDKPDTSAFLPNETVVVNTVRGDRWQVQPVAVDMEQTQ